MISLGYDRKGGKPPVWWKNYAAHIISTEEEYPTNDRIIERTYDECRGKIFHQSNSGEVYWYIDFEDENDYIAMVLKWS